MADYFTKETDKYIEKFLKSEDSDEKHELFNEGIRPAFEKLIENLIFVYKFFTLDDVETLKQECLANLYVTLPKFKPERGTKGFSYFNVVSKNWFIQKTRERTKKNKRERELYVDIDQDFVRNNLSTSYCSYEKAILEQEKWKSLFVEFDYWRTKMTKENEAKVLEAVIFLMLNSDLVSIYNKKAVYLYLREMTNLNEKQVAMNLKKMRVLYAKWSKRFFKDGV